MENVFRVKKVVDSPSQLKTQGTLDHIHSTMISSIKDTKLNTVEIEEQCTKLEEDVEKTMAEWIERRGKTELDLLSEGKMPVELFPTLDYIGMDVILNIYCSRSLNFSPIYFKEQLALLNIGVLETHKIYKVFDKWRIQACDAFKIRNSHKDIYITPTRKIAFKKIIRQMSIKIVRRLTTIQCCMTIT